MNIKVSNRKKRNSKQKNKFNSSGIGIEIEGTEIKEAETEETEKEKAEIEETEIEETETEETEKEETEIKETEIEEAEKEEAEIKETGTEEGTKRETAIEEVQKAEEVPEKKNGRTVKTRIPPERGNKEKKKKDKQQKEGLRYSILIIPNNHHRIKQYTVSIDFVMTISAITAAVVIALAFVFTLMLVRNSVLKADYERMSEAYRQVSDNNILLQADNEQLEASLREAKITIEASKNFQMQEEEKKSELYQPNALPVANASSLKSEFSSEKPYVEFNVGYGTKVIAAGQGSVSSVTAENGIYTVVVDHGNSYESVYCMGCTPSVNEKDKVARGTTLFNSDGDNLTLVYQIKFNGVAQDPMKLIKIDG